MSLACYFMSALFWQNSILYNTTAVVAMTSTACSSAMVDGGEINPALRAASHE